MRLDEKHRPHVFSDVAGQDKAVKVLSTVDCGGRGIFHGQVRHGQVNTGLDCGGACSWLSGGYYRDDGARVDC